MVGRKNISAVRNLPRRLSDHSPLTASLFLRHLSSAWRVTRIEPLSAGSWQVPALTFTEPGNQRSSFSTSYLFYARVDLKGLTGTLPPPPPPKDIKKIKISPPTDWPLFCPPSGQETIIHLRMASKKFLVLNMSMNILSAGSPLKYHV